MSGKQSGCRTGLLKRRGQVHHAQFGAGDATSPARRYANGVLALYALEKESFSKDQLDIMLSIETVFAMAVENTLQCHQANVVVSESLAGVC